MSTYLNNLLMGALCLVPSTAAAAKVVQVFVVAGQSNAVGSGSDANGLPPSLHSPQTDVLFWYSEGGLGAVGDPSNRLTSGMNFLALQYQPDPQGLAFDVAEGFGPEIKLGRDLSDALAVDVVIVKFAFNATSLVWDWDPNRSGSLYGQVITEVNSALARLTTMGNTGHVAGFFWMQGEADAWATGSAAADYQANLTAFIQQIRTGVSNAGMPFVLARLNTNIWMSPYGITQAKLTTVRTGQQNVAASVTMTSMVNTDDLALAGDHIHFVASGQITLGQRFASAYLTLMPPIPGDFDGDRDIDSADLMVFKSCFSRSKVPHNGTHTCRGADADHDGDVDPNDMGILQRCYRGPNVSGDPNCAG